MPARILFPIIVTDWHYHNSGPEKMRTAHSKKIFSSPDPYIYISGSCPVFEIQILNHVRNAHMIWNIYVRNIMFNVRKCAKI